MDIVMSKKEGKVVVDGNEYLLSDLSDVARDRVRDIAFVEESINQLQNEWAVADTARIAYHKALTNEVAKLSNLKSKSKSKSKRKK